MTGGAANTRYPGYDVLNKAGTPSWDAVTREVVNKRLSTPLQPRFFNADQWAAATALCACIVAQPDDRPAVPVAAMLDAKLFENQGDGWRDARMPPLREAWRLGLAALDAESRVAENMAFAQLGPNRRKALVERMQRGELNDAAWKDMPPGLFFSERVLHDLYAAYYSHPTAWSEIGFGGPANPRGYVRMIADRRDPWEAIAATPDNAATVSKDNARVR